MASTIEARDRIRKGNNTKHVNIKTRNIIIRMKQTLLHD